MDGIKNHIFVYLYQQQKCLIVAFERIINHLNEPYVLFFFVCGILIYFLVCLFFTIIINNALHYRVEGQRNFCVLYAKQEILMKPRQLPHALYCFFTCFFRTLPTIHVAGTAKGGTSSIYAYLIQHPYIHGSIICKESQYFQGRSFLGYYPFDWFNDYLRLPFFLSSFLRGLWVSPVLDKKYSSNSSRKDFEENRQQTKETLAGRGDRYPWDKIVYRTFFPSIFHRYYCSWIRGDPFYHVIDAQPTLRLPAIASRLAATNTDGKCIIILRDPIERAYSHYKMVKRNVPQMESRSFEEAIIEEMDLHDEEIRTGQLSLGSQIHRLCNMAQSYGPLYMLSDKMDAIKLDLQKKQRLQEIDISTQQIHKRTKNNQNPSTPKEENKNKNKETFSFFDSSRKSLVCSTKKRKEKDNIQNRLKINLFKYSNMNLSGGSLALWFLDKRYADPGLYANHIPHFTEAFGTDENGKSKTLILSFADLESNELTMVNKICKFLEIPSISSSNSINLEKKNIDNVLHVQQDKQPGRSALTPKTLARLEKFFLSSNAIVKKKYGIDFH